MEDITWIQAKDWPLAIVYINPKTLEFYVEMTADCEPEAESDAKIVKETLLEMRSNKYKELYNAAKALIPFPSDAAMQLEELEKNISIE